MSLFDVVFKKYDGGLGRALEGDDHISGLVFKDADATSDVFHLFYALSEAETAGYSATLEPALYYQIAQYFAQQPQGVLYVLVTAGDVAAGVVSIQNFAEGNIKQVGVLDTAAFATSTVTALQAKAQLLADAHKDLVILYSTTGFSSTTVSALPDLTTSQSPNVSVLVGADVSGRNALGAALGTVSLATVAENIGAIKLFNVVKSSEYDVLGFATSEAYRGKTDAELSTLKGKGYVFLRKYTGFTGSFFSDATTATSPTSVFASIENNRTIQKVQRVIRKALLPELGGALKAKKGILEQLTITKFELLVKNQLEAMANNEEIEDFKIVINPAQNVLATSKLEIQVGITPLGVARMIEVGIGFAL